MAAAEIKLPTGFTAEHERAVMSYLRGDLHGRQAWQLAFVAFDLLGQASLVTPDGRYSFRALYLEVVDHQMAVDYIWELLAMENVKRKVLLCGQVMPVRLWLNTGDEAGNGLTCLAAVFC